MALCQLRNFSKYFHHLTRTLIPLSTNSYAVNCPPFPSYIKHSFVTRTFRFLQRGQMVSKRCVHYRYTYRTLQVYYRTLQIYLPYITGIPTVHYRCTYRTLQVYLPYITDIPTVHYRYTYRTIHMNQFQLNNESG